MNTNEFLGFAKLTAAYAGDKILMKNYGKMQELEWTAKQHFRTEVDTQSNEYILKRIKETFPEHNIYSEEDDDVNNDSEYDWLIDPLDGTIPYRQGITDHFSVCIALAKNKKPIMGVTYAPKRGELYYAQEGKGAFCQTFNDNKKITVSLEDNINHTLMGLDGGKETKDFKRADITKYIDKVYSPNGITCFLASGCASVPLALTAAGKLHAYMALSLEPWDMAAGTIITREAGAKVTNIKGKEWDITDPSILAANPVLHEKLLEIFK
ncbi:inositol monophosphatase [Candidatus Pacearchaeota archaeon]|nr:inositol monophosphatase [Candidatus Pacearchaeota archaeon]